MKIIRFINKKMEILSDFNWTDLHNTDELDDKDLRFTLYDGPIQAPKATALFFDIDNLPKEKEDLLGETIDNHFNYYEFYILFTGGGYHVYLPIEKPFTKEDSPYYVSSYQSLCKKFEDKLGHPFDKQVFGATKYGRVVGSINSKSNERVNLCFYNEGQRLEGLDKVLKRRRGIRRTTQVKTKQENDELEQHILYKNCNLIRQSCRKKTEINYKVWKKIVMAFAAKQSHTAAHEFSMRLEKYDKDAVDTFFNVEKPNYFVSCKKLREDYREWRKDENPCHGCRHNVPVNGLPNITGTLPTPSFTRGFHTQKTLKNKGAEDTYMLDHENIAIDDVINYAINKNRNDWKVNERTLYQFNGKIYKAVWNNIYKEEDVTGEFSNQISDIPLYGIQKSSSLKKVLKYFPSVLKASVEHTPMMDDSNLIAFNNGVYDLHNMVFKQHGRENLILNHTHINYNESAKCPTFLHILKKVLIGEDKIELFRCFAGLALSNIPPKEYQQFLWFHGPPGSGKTGVSTILSNILTLGNDNENTVIRLSPKIIYDKSKNFDYDLRGTKMIFLDDLKLRDSLDALKAFEDWIVPFISADTVSCRILFRSAFNAPLTATFFLTSNEIPRSIRGGQGLLRRMRTLEFHRHMDGRELGQAIAECLNDSKEMEGIAYWMLTGLKEMRRKGQLLPDKTEEERNFIDVQGYLDEEIIVEKFLEDNYTVAMNWKASVPLPDIYLKFMKEGKVQNNLGKMTFNQIMVEYIGKKLGLMHCAVKKKRRNGSVILHLEPK